MEMKIIDLNSRQVADSKCLSHISNYSDHSKKKKKLHSHMRTVTWEIQ